MLPEIKTMSDWGKIFTKIDIWEPYIKESMKEHGIHVNDIKSGYPGTNAVFIVNDTYIIKIYAPVCPYDDKKELQCYKILQRGNIQPIPKIYGYGCIGDPLKLPYLIMEYKRGEAIREVYDKMTEENRIKLAAEIAHIVKRMHSIDIYEEDMLITPDGWGSLVRSSAENILDDLKKQGISNKRLLDEIYDYVKNYKKYINNKVYLIDGDLTEDHILLEFDNVISEYYLTCLFDFADAEIGQMEYDMIPLWFGMFNENVNMFKNFIINYDERIKMDESFRDRLFMFTFLHKFGADIIKDVLNRHNIKQVNTLTELKDILWPKSLFDANC